MMNNQVILTLSSALAGGVIGAAITSITKFRLWQRQQREEAAKALWEYHYALSACAAKSYESLSEEGGYATLLESNFNEVQVALRKAYPFAGFLSRSARQKLFHHAWIEHGDFRDMEDNLYGKNLSDLAECLELELDWWFPRRIGSRVRVALHCCKSRYKIWNEAKKRAKSDRQRVARNRKKRSQNDAKGTKVDGNEDAK
jgi:hypothetical protein